MPPRITPGRHRLLACRYRRSDRKLSVCPVLHPKRCDPYAEKIAFRADSILAQLGDQEFAEGLAALREHAAIALPNEPVIELIDFFVFRPNALTSAAD